MTQHNNIALIHFNMATYAKDGDPGCDASNWNQKAIGATGPTRNPATFQPIKLNTTQWFDSITALGANIAVLTAKHGCGFLLWPTDAVLPLPSASTSTSTNNNNINNSTARIRTTSYQRQQRQRQRQRQQQPYGYHTNNDVLQQFVDSAKASGVGYGFYYSIMKNFFLCRSFSGENSCL